MRAGSPEAGATACIVVAATTIVATIAIAVRNFVNAASISAHLLSCSEASVRSIPNSPVTVSKHVANGSAATSGRR